ncbi:MAG: hypothetical protein KGI75_29370 [Rhizobiaceae bacterium]|nr:hypothetical protein [Rhizobiaceae bacterium]
MGTWQVRRKIIDRFTASIVTFEGEAFITPAHFEEHGDTHHGSLALRSSRTYRLRREGDEVAVDFPDFREFVRVGYAASQRLEHRCGADDYTGRLFFRSLNAWAEIWHVRGPRKPYLSLAHYQRS